MKYLMLAMCVALFSVTVRAEEPKPEAPKVDAAAGELPKAPEGTAPTSAAESLVGSLHKGPLTNAKGKVKKGGNANPDAILLLVESGDAGKKAMKNARQVSLSASGNILTQLTSLADKSAHVKVTGSVNGDTMTVKEISEVPAAEAKKKKKKDA